MPGLSCPIVASGRHFDLKSIDGHAVVHRTMRVANTHAASVEMML